MATILEELQATNQALALLQAQLAGMSQGSGLISGEIKIFPVSDEQPGFLVCDGREVSRATYLTLFTVLGSNYGFGDGVNTFNLPDYRGQFLRGHDYYGGFDPDKLVRTDRGDGTVGSALGTRQDSALSNHSHPIDGDGADVGDSSSRVHSVSSTGLYFGVSTGAVIGANTSTETRPCNVTVSYQIKI